MNELPNWLNTLLEGSQPGQVLTAQRIAISLLASFVISRIICFVYDRTPHASFVSQSASVTITLVCLVTTMLIMPISANIILSLGMVGALSIVRFRSALKSPVDIAFLFWAIAVGIANGAGFLLVSVLGSGLISVCLLSIRFLPNRGSEPYLLVVRYQQDKQQDVIQKIPKKHRLLTKVVTDEVVDLTVEISSKTDMHSLSDSLQPISIEVSILCYQGKHIPS